MPTTEQINYEVQGVELIGHLASPETPDVDERPGVVLLHEGGGQDDNVRARGERLAALGYTSFALDYLGGGTLHPLPTAQARLGELIADPAASQELALAGYRILCGQPSVDTDRIAA